MVPRERSAESDNVPTQGQFELIHHSLEYSVLGQTQNADTTILQITTKGDQKVAVAVPKGEDPVPYVRRAVELVESGETQGTILKPIGDQNGREEV